MLSFLGPGVREQLHWTGLVWGPSSGACSHLKVSWGWRVPAKSSPLQALGWRPPPFTELGQEPLWRAPTVASWPGPSLGRMRSTRWEPHSSAAGLDSLLCPQCPPGPPVSPSQCGRGPRSSTRTRTLGSLVASPWLRVPLGSRHHFLQHPSFSMKDWQRVLQIGFLGRVCLGIRNHTAIATGKLQREELVTGGTGTWPTREL